MAIRGGFLEDVILIWSLRNEKELTRQRGSMCACAHVHRCMCGAGDMERVSERRNTGAKSQSSRIAGMPELEALEDNMETWKLCRGLIDVNRLWFLRLIYRPPSQLQISEPGPFTTISENGLLIRPALYTFSLLL